jgi:hypothetical protein
LTHFEQINWKKFRVVLQGACPGIVPITKYILLLAPSRLIRVPV